MLSEKEIQEKVPCPTCKASRGLKCQTINTKMPMQMCHTSRSKRANEVVRRQELLRRTI